jgi:putative oligomerization/nucleic acid binding protein
MNRTNMLRLAGSLILSGFLSGCFSFGSGDETIQQTKATTTGQELQDLKAAYDKGIISEREYNQQRDKILKGQ